MAFGLPAISSNTHSNSSLFQKKHAKTHIQVDMNAQPLGCYMDALTHDNPLQQSKKKEKPGENMQHRWEAELDQRWDRYCCNNTAMADLQISLFRAQPFA